MPARAPVDLPSGALDRQVSTGSGGSAPTVWTSPSYQNSQGSTTADYPPLRNPDFSRPGRYPTEGDLVPVAPLRIKSPPPIYTRTYAVQDRPYPAAQMQYRSFEALSTSPRTREALQTVPLDTESVELPYSGDAPNAIRGIYGGPPPSEERNNPKAVRFYEPAVEDEDSVYDTSAESYPQYSTSGTSDLFAAAGLTRPPGLKDQGPIQFQDNSVQGQGRQFRGIAGQA